MPSELTAVTYVRRSDRTRVVFVLPLSEPSARLVASILAPHDTTLAAVKPLDGSRMVIPMDGDGYQG